MSNTKSTSKLDVLIINYNSSKYTEVLVKSLKKISNIISNIIIIDNNSRDVSVLLKLQGKLKGCKIILNTSNRGFSRAVNQGVQLSTANYILLINPDCVLVDTSIKLLFNSITMDKSIGIIGGRIIDHVTKESSFSANNKPGFLTGLFEFTNLKKIFPNNQFTNNFWIEKKNTITEPIQVYSLCGAFIIFQKNMPSHNKHGPLDEDYFLYLEDMQFGHDTTTAGYKVIFDPRAEVLHHGGKSSDSKYNSVLKYWYESRKIYFRKNLPLLQSIVLTVVFTIEEHILQAYHHISHTPNE